MKKFLTVALAVVMLLCALLSIGCSNEKKIIGTWKLASDSESDFATYMTFTEDGKLAYSVEYDNNGSGYGLDTSKLVEETYTIVDDTTITVTAKALLFTQTKTYVYSLKGDKLVFDGSTYERIKD